MSILYLAREPFRRACLRVSLHYTSVEDDSNDNQTLDQKAKDQSLDEYHLNLRQIVQIAWLSVPYGVIVCIGGFYFFDWLFVTTTQKDTDRHDAARFNAYYQSLWLHVISCGLGLITEPFYIVAQNLLLFRIRFKIEGIALMLKVFVPMILIMGNLLGSGDNSSKALLAFGYGHIAYQGYMAIGYFLHFYHHAKDYRMRRGILELIPDFSVPFNSTLVWLTTGFWLQTVVKFFLTEGEKYVMILLQTLSDQGVYDLVSQLGSLAARLVFQPIEENSFTIWSKALKSHNGSSAKTVVDSDVRSSADMLQLLVKLFIIIGCCFVFFGPNYSYTLLYMLYGQRWTSGTEAPRVLAFYCLYVMMMALNGTTEGFVHAASTPKQTQWFNLLMVFFSIAYLGSAVFCLTVLNLGTPSLIIANCINMALRVLFSTWFIIRFFKYLKPQEQEAVSSEEAKSSSPVFAISRCIPHVLVWSIFLLSFVITRISEMYLEKRGWSMRIAHILVGCVCLLLTAFIIRLKERSFLVQVRKLLSGKSD